MFFTPQVAVPFRGESGVGLGAEDRRNTAMSAGTANRTQPGDDGGIQYRLKFTRITPIKTGFTWTSESYDCTRYTRAQIAPQLYAVFECRKKTLRNIQ